MSTLINDNVALKDNLGAVDANFTWASIKSYVEDVERDIIAETISDDAVAYFAGNPALTTGVYPKALTLIKRAEAYLSVLKWSQMALYRLTDKALYVAKTSDGVIISDKKLHSLRTHCEETGFDFLDKAITVMEANLDQFTAYRDSNVRQGILEGFVKTASDFSRQRNINNSRITFMSVHAIMLDVQAEQLPKVMGQAYYELFHERYKDEELSSNENKLLPIIKKAVAFLTLAQACRELPVKITKGGLLVNKYNDTREYEQANPATQAEIDFTAEDLQDKADRKLLELRAYLIANASLYPGFIVPEQGNVSPNCADSGIFIF